MRGVCGASTSNALSTAAETVSAFGPWRKLASVFALRPALIRAFACVARTQNKTNARAKKRYKFQNRGSDKQAQRAPIVHPICNKGRSQGCPIGEFAGRPAAHSIPSNEHLVAERSRLCGPRSAPSDSARPIPLPRALLHTFGATGKIASAGSPRRANQHHPARLCRRARRAPAPYSSSASLSPIR